jgi:predicted ATPase/class 3 adenylate cyclase
MKCPECQFDNREGAKFCISCGTKLEINCSKCSHLNPPESKFCEECGSQLNLLSEQAPQELSFDEKIAKIQKYLPQGVTEKILAQKDRIEGERKQVTVMFCDMEGFTQLSEKLGPEEAYTIMDQVYEILIHKVHDYEGTINEMTGDGVMALFGAPIALEDAPQRAIRSAYAIHREMTRFSDKMKQEKEGIPPLRMRIGIHTGPVVVGTLGNDLRVEFKAVGDTVNLASRIEKIAEPGATYVAEETFKLTEGFFRFEALGEKKIKGKEGIIKTYRVVATSSRRTKFDVSAERGLTSFVGRERELELLLDGFERSKEGHGQAFSIMAEAGIGKSRLLYEFRKAVANEDVTLLEGKCLSYSRGIAYHPVIDILKSNFDINENDGDFVLREKVLRGLEVLGADEASTMPYLLELLSAKDSGIDQIPMSPEARKDRIMRALRRIVLKGSEIKPLIMAFEDLHWVDKSSEDLLKDLLDSISGARVFLIFTYRPEFIHRWGGRSYYSQITLNRLSNRESLIMVSHLLGTQDIERELAELILEKAEGIPFFIEEFAKSLKELKIIEKKDNEYRLVAGIQKVTIPSTIQDLIMARVDSLPESAKEILQTGSVIEREFSYELIKQVTDLPEQELLSYLSILKDSELLYERGIYPISTYIFKHALTHEIVRESILKRRRKAFHEKIGNAIEKLYPGNIREYYGVLANHFVEAGNFEKGAEYSRLASSRARKEASFNEAITYGKRRIACLEALPRTEDVEKWIIDARTTVGLYYNQMVFLIEAKQTIEPIVDLAFKLDYRKGLSQIYCILGTHDLAIEDDYSKAIKHLQAAVDLAEELNDFASLWMAHHWIGHAYFENCEFEPALFHIEKSLKIVEMAKVPWSIAITKSCIAWNIYGRQGRIDLAHQTSQEALKIAEECDDTFSKADVYPARGIIFYYKGFCREAEKYLQEGSVYCKKINYALMGCQADFYLGELYFDREEYQKSEDYFKRTILALENIQAMPCFLYLSKIALLKAMIMMNERDIDLSVIYEYEPKNTMRFIEGGTARNIGEVFLNIDKQHMSEAEHWIDKAIEADRGRGLMWQLGRDYELHAELFLRQGDQLKARESLGKAIGIMTDCGADGWVKKYKNELAKL